MTHCGGCTLCCKLLGIPTLEKPAMQWCPHCLKGTGCGIYADRPPECVDFECLWLQTQVHGKEAMPLDLRPDKTKCVMSSSTDGKSLVVHVDPGFPTAWRKDPINQLLIRLAEHGLRVIIGVGLGREKVLLKRVSPGVVTMKKIMMSEPDEMGMQWYDPTLPENQ